jgi:hypothetical protein
MRLREDPRGGLVLERGERLLRIVPTAEAVGTGLDERANQRTVLLERGPVRAGVLLERDRDVRARLQVPAELEEGTETKGPQGVEEIRGAKAGGHAHPRYAPRGSVPAWQAGHQYARRAFSPCGHERIAAPQRGQGLPGRR